MTEFKIAVIGLGYVGLPLARLFATKYPVVGYDINRNRISELMEGNDSTLEVESSQLQSVLVPDNPVASMLTKEEGGHSSGLLHLRPGGTPKLQHFYRDGSDTGGQE